MTLMKKICSNHTDLLKSACRTPPVCRFSQICHWTVTYMCLQKFPPGLQIFQSIFSKIYHWTVTYICLQNYPQFADFLKSATGQLLTCACRNPSSLQIFSNLPLDSYLHVLAEIPPFADFLKSATGQLLTCACRNSPPICKFSKIFHWTVTYMCLQKFPPPFADFLKSATGHLLTCACRNPLSF